MKYISTRGHAPAPGLSAALAAGLAPDGGLYVPQSLPKLAPSAFDGCSDLPAVAARLLAPFFAGDALATELEAICRQAFTFPAPLHPLATPRDHVLELFHGPTAAFKDFGARFLAACMQRLPRDSGKPLTIVVATSGDTGAAVGAAFANLPGFKVAILYPDGRVSPRQAHQLGCFGGNVRAFRVDGAFDDCQRMAKQALSDGELRAIAPLSSANSISLGRLLPQMAYYADAALRHLHATGVVLNFVVPTGNLGNAVACVLARACGLPIGRIALATNANRVLPDFFAGADYSAQPSVATIANAMDVGAPSNFERLTWLYPDAAALRREFVSLSVDDETIRATIRERHARHGEVLCPHTATAMHLLDTMRANGSAKSIEDWAIVSTAHAAKFDSIVEPLIGMAVPLPPGLAALLARPAHADSLANDYAALREILAAN
ncbi:MAG: threonine synthase [Proteobacteria bacterium]|uniref:threonine synthase n=1 Tax=Rudaea sp. TaxID=2136325 RepID=UPI001DD756F8|nr:threonine synthase [Pseudomonadota bacterium]MBS0565999.1 threonine synthase [Pseudomonadota bacterium]